MKTPLAFIRYSGRGSDSPKDGRAYNAVMDAMSRALRKKLLGHHSQKRLSEHRCQVDLHDHRSTRTTGRRTQWSTSAIISI